jgi:hypothetical protein
MKYIENINFGSLQDIGKKAFFVSEWLINLIIPQSIETIWIDAFSNNRNLKNIEYKGTTNLC